jgi:integrase/recombinase XerD
MCHPRVFHRATGACGDEPVPVLDRSSTAGGEARYALDDPLVDSYLEFVAGRSRPNTLRAVAHDLKTFFTVIDKGPVDVVAADIFEFVADQRGDRTGVRISDGESGLSARTIARRLSSISGFYAYLVAGGDTSVMSSPGAARPLDSSSGWPPPAGAVGAGSAHTPQDPQPGRGDRCWRRCGRIGTERSSTRWCWAGCAAARSSA